MAPRRQLLRLDLRQVGDLAAGWGAYRLGSGAAVAMSHFVLRRTRMAGVSRTCRWPECTAGLEL